MMHACMHKGKKWPKQPRLMLHLRGTGMVAGNAAYTGLGRVME